MLEINIPDNFVPLERESVPELDRILGLKFPVLDDGFIRAIDYMGSDSAFVQAARISYGKGTKHSSDDRSLIRRLIRHRHTSVFEMAELKLHIRIPMDHFRQMVRHRTANINEYSTRYSEAIDSQQKTAPGEWRLQSTTNKQGSEGKVIDTAISAMLSTKEIQFHALAQEIYQERLKVGVAREKARKDLPLSTYTELYWKCDVHNILHFLSLRKDLHAQLEIRQYADIIGGLIELWCPFTWEAFEDFRIKAMSLSALDIKVLKCINIMPLALMPFTKLLIEMRLLKFTDEGKVKPITELLEMKEKFKLLGVKLEWSDTYVQPF